MSAGPVFSLIYKTGAKGSFLGFNEGEPHFYKQAFLEKATNNQLTELETNCVIQPSPLPPAAPHLPGNPYFWKTKTVGETAGSWQSEGQRPIPARRALRLPSVTR